MARLIIILGHPGSGKSTSLRNLKNDQVGYVSVSGKELPFKPDFKPVVERNLNKLTAIVKNAKKPMVVFDDINFVFNHEIYSKATEPDQWKVFRELKDDFYRFIEAINNKEGNQNFYLLGHLESNDSGLIQMKTQGQAIRNSITPEAYSNIVLEAVNDLGDFVFKVKSDGTGIKSPGIDKDAMFEGSTIPNDLALVEQSIRKYYKETK